MGIITVSMGFLRFDRAIVYVFSAVLAFYAFFFYSKGYPIGLLFLVWAALGVLANIVVKVKPIVAYASFAAVSFVLFYTLRYFIPELKETPHFQVFSVMLTVLVGGMIDTLYWVRKYDSGSKYKTDYDE